MISIDLGSNTIRVLKYNCKNNQKIAEYEKVVRTAQNLHIDGTIDNSAILRVVDAINEAKSEIDFDDTIVAVTTEAMRQATNSKYVIDEIYRKCGIKFEIIDGEKEANLTLLAIKDAIKRLDIKSKKFVLVDIGGGSTEVVFYDGKNSISKSFKVGIVTFTTKYKDKSIEELRECIKDEMKELYKYVKEYYNENSVDSFISTAGTPTTISAIKHGMNYKSYDANIINGTFIDKNDLKNTLELLLSLSKEKKEELVGVNRDDLIISGILILDEIFDILEFDDSLVIDDGLREGVALEYCLKYK